MTINGFGQTDIEGTVFPVTQVFSQLKTIGLKFFFDIFFSSGQGFFEKVKLVFNRSRWGFSGHE